MLERTAVGLESGNLNLRRVLPRSTPTSRRPTGSSRTAGFSQTTRGSWRRTQNPSATRQQRHASIARAEPPLVLDFLYPRSTLALLRQHPPPSAIQPGRTGLGHASASASRGDRSSSSIGTAQFISTDTHHHQTTQDRIDQTPAALAPGFPSTRWDGVEVTPKKTYNVDKNKNPTATVDDAVLTAEQEIVRSPIRRADSAQLDLSGLLEDSHGTSYDGVWDLYCRLDVEERSAIRPRVVQYLSRSQSVVETGRALSLLRQVPVEKWDNKFLSSAVLILVRSGHQDRAVEVFKQSLSSTGLVGGFEYLLIDSVNRQDWPTLLDAWMAYCDHVAQKTPGRLPDQKLLEPISSLRSLGALYFSFERYLAADEMKVQRRLDQEESSKRGLHVLRRRFAVEALREPCPPNQAATILSFWRNRHMYQRYLWRMFDRWYTKKISTSTARMLPDIYRDFKSLPGAKPSADILRGIFKVHYPTDMAALESLYQDWMQARGELSQWGFEKFLKLFASRGDVARVKELWGRYVELFPSSLETPRGFRTTLNAYAQAGDVAGAEAELDRMVNHYKVQPDIDTWNVMLKCYMRAGDYDKVTSRFHEVCRTHQPDSFTYAHVMAMCAKKGDLDQATYFFNEAQKNGVALSREMGLSLVVAYCQNDLLREAEKICTELARRKVTSTAMWNQLLHYNGMHGRLNRCYELLNTMKNFDVEWDHDTIGYLLDALVRVNQVGPAFQVVRDALKSRLHVLRPEHFATVMLGAFRTRDRRTAESLISLMEEASMPVPFGAMVEYAHVSLREAPYALRTPELGKQVLASLKTLVSQLGSDVRRLRRETRSMGRAVQLLVQSRDFGTAEELINVFIDMFPQYRENGVFPQDVLSSLMLAYHRDGNHEQVLALWNDAWPRILQRCSVPDGTRVYPAHQYDVTRLVYRLAETYKATSDGKGLAVCVDRVTSAGFKLTSATWDRVVCNLVDLGQWEPAMDWCEKMLMPAWRGWNPGRMPLDQRRETLNPNLLQPTHRAVLALQREWLKMSRLSAWSAEVTRKLVDVERRHPMLYNAFLTHDDDDDDLDDMPAGPWVLRDGADLDKAMDDMLKPLSVKELHAMEKALKKKLAVSAAAAAAGEGAFYAADEKRRDVRSLQEKELDLLRSVLAETLADRVL